MVNEELCQCEDCGQVQDKCLRFGCKNCGAISLVDIKTIINNSKQRSNK
jgi:hypothetical protein